MEAYAELHEIRMGRGLHERRRKAYACIFGKFRKSCCRTALMNTPGGIGGSVVLATNKTAEDLQRANDLEMIHKVQQAATFPSSPDH